MYRSIYRNYVKFHTLQTFCQILIHKRVFIIFERNFMYRDMEYLRCIGTYIILFEYFNPFKILFNDNMLNPWIFCGILGNELCRLSQTKLQYVLRLRFI